MPHLHGHHNTGADTSMVVAEREHHGWVHKSKRTTPSPSGGDSGRYFGMLHVYVIEGENVAHSFSQFRRRRSQQGALTRVTCGVDMCGCDGPDACFGKADPFCSVDLEIGGGKSYRLGRTQTMDNSHNPKWAKEFSCLVDVDPQHTPFTMDFQSTASGPNLIVRVYDDDVGGESFSDILGQATFPLREATSRGRPLRVSLAVRHPKSRQNSLSLSRVKVEFRWYPFLGVIADPHSLAVPHTYFRRSHGNLVKLYHDAECFPNAFPAITTHTSCFSAHSAWDDISRSIENAKHFVFLAGWSVNPAISLRRNYQSSDQPETLGELLKRKAEAGVNVCILIWDDITSREGVRFLKDGIMATYDEYTRDYFKTTPVNVAVVKRIAGDDVGEISDLLKWTSFTHHQKIVLYDTMNPLDPQGRRIVGSYIGGLDLTAGRYDTGEHPLFTTLKTAHADDFYNGCLVEATSDIGPRQPWHDIHAQIEGPAAWDVLQTYIERVAKQAPKLIASLSGLVTDLRDRKKLRDGRKVLIDPQDPRSWDVQFFRSLDSEAALFENAKWTAKFANCVHFAEKSIQQAYCYIINRAQKSIFLENQYFLGSAQYWRAHDDVSAHNLVPYELTRRICRAIEEGELFTVYCLIPLFPEGAPGSVTVQEILHWQYQTIRMMYYRIGQKLREAGNTHNHPLDYLQFFYPGKREPDTDVKAPASAAVDVADAITHRRHPIYVHSKMMIVDDEYIIIGSANINDRSMAGCRDTEIAFGASQPSARYANGQFPQGDIHAFRLQLWHEHFGEIRQEFERPGDLECSRMTQRLARENFDTYCAELNASLPHGHACAYPYYVDQSGETTAIPDQPNIPGWTCPVIGARSSLLPASLTS